MTVPVAVPATAVTGPSLTASPWALHLHPVAWILVLGSTALYAGVIRQPDLAVGRRQAWSFLGAVIVLLAALTWPMADLAAHHLLVALVVQRLLLMLAVPPLLLRGLPTNLVVRATRPAAVDDVLGFLSRPVPAVLLVTVVAVTTLATPAVDAQGSSAAARAGIDAALLIAGVVLWLPVLRTLPGAPRLSALGRAGYLVVQSVVPSFLAVVWIFARHPLYPLYAHAGRTFGMSPLLDQQIAGFVAKLATIAVLWSVAAVIVHRAERQPEDDDGIPLTWADVERHLERAERRKRGDRQRRQRAALPRPPGFGDRPWADAARDAGLADLAPSPATEAEGEDERAGPAGSDAEPTAAAGGERGAAPDIGGGEAPGNDGPDGEPPPHRPDDPRAR